MMASVQLCANLMICEDPMYFRALGHLGDNRVGGSEAQKVNCPRDRLRNCPFRLMVPGMCNKAVLI